MRLLVCIATVGIVALAAAAFGQDKPMPESVRRELAQAESQKPAKAKITKATYMIKGLH
ncbi:MAG: hypothetical protein HY000_02705 [Planctomycetes bacterium]|nr:hypothetical protein [Planctomycetota bacterium]